MSTLRFISSAADLPKPGTSEEHLQLDFKAYWAPGPSSREMAKDVAAFANAEGGVLVIGATHKAGCLEYTPLLSEVATSIAEGYRMAVKRHCRPHAVIDPRLILYEGGAIAAINVIPYPAPPIGVDIEERGDAWVFPARRGSHTYYLPPEELATLMDPVYRRKVLQVQGIPTQQDQGRPCKLHCVDSARVSKHERGVTIGAGTSVRSEYRARIVHIDPVAGILVAQGDNPSKIVVPLDAVNGVWKDDSDTDHHVAIKGVLAEEGNRLWFMPS